MKSKSSISMGPGAASLILIFVMLSLSVLAMLSLSGSINDEHFSSRSIEVTEEIYALYERAELTRAALMNPDGADSAQLTAEELTITDGAAGWLEKDGVYTLSCEIDEEGAWLVHRLTIDRAEAEEEEWDWD